jgi:hypothetical protein
MFVPTTFTVMLESPAAVRLLTPLAPPFTVPVTIAPLAGASPNPLGPAGSGGCHSPHAESPSSPTHRIASIAATPRQLLLPEPI